MSTEIQKAPQRANVGFNLLDPNQFEIMQRACRLFASSDLVPEIYQAKFKPVPAGANEAQVAAIQAENQSILTKAMANCMIALDYAYRVGASPLMVMQNVAIIYGRPCPASKFLIATVNSCGRFEPLQFRFTNLGNLGKVNYVDYEWSDQARKKVAKKMVFDGSDVQNIECVAYTTKVGSDAILESVPVSIRMAVEEGWYTKNGSKWVTMSKLMLSYRAASMWCNTYAPELSMGMRTIEEQQDIVDVEFEEIPVNRPERTRVDLANAQETPKDAPQSTQGGQDKQDNAATVETPQKPKETPNQAQPQAASTSQSPVNHKKPPF